MSAPLRNRFGIFYHLDFYSIEELSQIIKHSAKVLGVDIDKEASLEVAKRARGTPRIANRLLRRVRDYMQVGKHASIKMDIVNQTLNALGIDKVGLDIFDCKFLRTIIDNYSGGPVGIESLAASLNEEQNTIVDVIEPYLLKAGFLKRTNRGRQVTEPTYKHFGIKNRERQKELF